MADKANAFAETVKGLPDVLRGYVLGVITSMEAYGDQPEEHE